MKNFSDAIKISIEMEGMRSRLLALGVDPGGNLSVTLRCLEEAQRALDDEIMVRLKRKNR